MTTRHSRESGNPGFKHFFKSRFKAWIPAFAGMTMVLIPGCISISTYERQMKKSRDQAEELERVKSQLAAVEAKNADLGRSLEEKVEEQEALKSEVTNVRSTYDELIQELKDNIVSGEVGVKQSDQGLTITMGNQILFASGKSDLRPRGKKVLNQIAGVIKKSEDRLIQVEGHTDNARIASALQSRFPSNWDLSAARAAAVVRYLQIEGKIDPELLVLTAFAENRPIGDNATPQGRQENRRVEITLVPKKP